MKNKSDAQLLVELSDLDERSAKLRKEIDKRARESELNNLKRYVGNYYEDFIMPENYCHVIDIDKDYKLRGTILHKYSSKYFTLEFNHRIYPNDDNIYNNLRKITKEKWNKIIKGLKPEINKGLK